MHGRLPVTSRPEEAWKQLCLPCLPDLSSSRPLCVQCTVNRCGQPGSAAAVHVRAAVLLPAIPARTRRRTPGKPRACILFACTAESMVEQGMLSYLAGRCHARTWPLLLHNTVKAAPSHVCTSACTLPGQAPGPSRVPQQAAQQDSAPDNMCSTQLMVPHLWELLGSRPAGETTAAGSTVIHIHTPALHPSTTPSTSCVHGPASESALQACVRALIGAGGRDQPQPHAPHGVGGRHAHPRLPGGPRFQLPRPLLRAIVRPALPPSGDAPQRRGAPACDVQVACCSARALQCGFLLQSTAMPAAAWSEGLGMASSAFPAPAQQGCVQPCHAACACSAQHDPHAKF